MTAAMQPGTSYDELPYPSHAFVSSSPNRLATVARVFGLQPADLHEARVLELGCSSGGNLLPHAVAFPGGTFHGVDLSPRQIAIGQRTIDALGLTNATLAVEDLLTWRPEPESWDFIICHGVYSWVSPEVRAAILEICERGLSPHGIACISFNTEPGWSMQGVVTEAMNYLGRPGDDAHRRAAHARHVLEFLVRSLARSETPYAHTLARVFKATEHTTDSYIAHEYLDGFHQPMALVDFVRQAHRGQLQYLGDASLALMLPGLMGQETHQQLVRLATDVVSAEQYADFLWMRTFRNGLLVRRDAPVRRELQRFDASEFHVSCRIKPTQVDDATWELHAADTEVQFQTQHPALIAFLHACHGAWPRAPRVDALVAEAFAAMAVPEAMREQAKQAWSAQLSQWLIYGHAMGLVELHVHGHASAAEPSARPEAWAWARREALHTRMPTNLRHEVVGLDPLELFVLGRCDGDRDQDTILAELQSLVTTRNRCMGTDEPIPSADDLARVLATLATNAYLVRDADRPTPTPRHSTAAVTSTPATRPTHTPSLAPCDHGRPAPLAHPRRVFALMRALGMPLPTGQRIIDLDGGARCDMLRAEFSDVSNQLGDPAALVVAWHGLGSLSWSDLAASLEPGGYAVVRVNCRPGWYMLGAVHAMVRYHRSQHHVSIQTALEQLHALVGSMPDIDEVPWRRWFEAVMALAEEDPELREQLASPEVQALPLHQWVGDAAEAGLHYVCDARLPTTSRASLAPEVRAFVLDDLSTFGDRVRSEQIGDYTRNQYRRALVLTKQPVPERLSFDTDAISSLSLEPGDDDPRRWCLQPQPDALTVLGEPDSPPLALRIARLVREHGQAMDWSQLRSAVDVDDDDLVHAILASCEVGATRLIDRAPSPAHR